MRNGPESDGSTNSAGRGRGPIEFDPIANEFRVRIAFEGLVGDLSQPHVHGPASADTSTPRHVIEFLGPPEVPQSLATTQGTFETRLPLTATQQGDRPPLSPEAVLALLQGGHSYLNVHTTVFGMGEIRGNLAPPCPARAGFTRSRTRERSGSSPDPCVPRSTASAGRVSVVLETRPFA